MSDVFSDVLGSACNDSNSHTVTVAMKLMADLA